MNKLSKFYITIVIMLILYIPLSFITYIVFFNTIKYVDNEIYYRFATEDRFGEDIYFSDKANLKTNIHKTLENIAELQDKEIPSTQQKLFTILLTDEDLLKRELMKNEEYIQYLSKNNLSISDVIFYIKQISNLDMTILTGCFYLVSLAYILILYKMKFRISLYWIAGLLYIFSNLSIFTSGMFSNLFFPLMSWLGQNINQTITYDDYRKIILVILPTIKEAFLSYIIIDTLGQYYKDRKNRNTNRKLREFYYSVNVVLKNLKDISKKAPSVRVTQMQIDFNFFKKYCSKKKKDPSLKEIKLIIDTKLSSFIQKEASLSLTEAFHILEEINIRLIKSNIIKELVEDGDSYIF